MHKPTHMMIGVPDLTPASYNPPTRADLTKPKNRELMKSIMLVGMLYPILVCRTRRGGWQVVEGHCRLAIAAFLGWKEVPCIVVEGSPEDMYVHANVRSNLTNNDLLHIYLKKPDAVPAKQRARLARIEEKVGRDTLKAIKNWGGTTATYTQARSVARYLGEDADGGFVKDTLTWLMDNNQTKAARQAVDGGVPPAQLRRAIAENRPLTLRMSAE